MDKPDQQAQNQENSMVTAGQPADEAGHEQDTKTGIAASITAAIVLLMVGKPVKIIIMGAIMAGAAVHLSLTVLRLVKKASEKPTESRDQ